MPVLRANLGLPRKVVAYYLLFSALAIAWLAAGVFLVAHDVLHAKSVSFSLTRLGKLTSAIEVDFLRNGERNFQQQVQKAKSEAGLKYCGITSNAGKFLAHTDPSLVGTVTQYHTQLNKLTTGNLSGIQYQDESGVLIREYQLPLSSKGEPFATLLIGISEPTLASTLTQVAPLAPLAVLFPLGFIGLGALLISRLATPLSDIGVQLEQLAVLPPGEQERISEIPARNAVSLGWNRLAQVLSRLRAKSEPDSAESALKRSAGQWKNNQHSEILQNLSDGVAVFDPEGVLTFANQAVSALLGEEMTSGKNVDDLLSQLEESVKSQLDFRHSSRPVSCEARFVTDDSERILRVSRQPLTDSRSEGHLLCVRDITQQKLAEKMRDQFIDTATHELRTPLANIKAYAETLVTCDAIDVEEQKEFCNIINSEVTRLARFVDDLLSISSMEMGSLVINKQKVETERLFAEVLEKVEPLMQKKQLTFEPNLPDKMPEVKLDKDKMVAVLVNLLGNAAKYTPVGGAVKLHVKIENAGLEFSVADTGVGIAAEELPKVFEKFFRSSDPRIQEEVGTGLGLSLALEVIRMHGGDITAESELNKGTTFHVTIPLEGGE